MHQPIKPLQNLPVLKTLTVTSESLTWSLEKKLPGALKEVYECNE